VTERAKWLATNAIQKAWKLSGATSGGGSTSTPPSDVGGGTVFSLTPPGQGGTSWAETVLYLQVHFSLGHYPLWRPGA